MEQRLTEIAVSECGRGLREEIGGLRAQWKTSWTPSGAAPKLRWRNAFTMYS